MLQSARCLLYRRSSTYQTAAIPPVAAQYDHKGEFVEINGFKTCKLITIADNSSLTYHHTDKTGPSTATTALILVYDVFGFNAQIQQGADILAFTTSPTHSEGLQVFVPDFLKGDYADAGWFPPDTPEKQQAMGKFFGSGTLGNPQSAADNLLAFAKKLKAEGIKKIAPVGYCWGAKIIAMTSGAETPFSAAAYCHPSLLTAEEAPKITIPTAILASQDEDAELMKSFVAGLTVPKFLDTYSDSPHGWMTTRADLKDPKGKAAFEKGYAAVVKFL